MNDKPIVCIPNAIAPDQRPHYERLRQFMKNTVQNVAEVAQGYALHFPADAQTITNLAGFIALERLCCPFLEFALVVTDDSVSLHLTGGDGVKDFVKQEFAL
jgi:hypothetical protein